MNSTRRVTLPSGRTIDVRLVLGPVPAAPPAAPFDPDAPERCPVCASTFVQPVDWSPAGDLSWTLELRCPVCEHHGTAELDDAQVERYDALLDDGVEAIARDLDRLIRARLEAEVQRFAAELADGLIAPEDFVS